ncbi:hypothetical protein [Kitasatospora mediocidica]|uniref:hypothetical protein n=1 Tax=Kitasatospora mediocidica TaxID=58352 RepID=UPI0007C81BC5|nr:hypothetical protein [Kitasatospora mediocidica]
MTWFRSFAAFWYDFVVGDDWRVALGVVVAPAATAGLVRGGINAWWLPPAAVAVLLALSLRRGREAQEVTASADQTSPAEKAGFEPAWA